MSLHAKVVGCCGYCVGRGADKWEMQVNYMKKLLNYKNNYIIYNIIYMYVSRDSFRIVEDMASSFFRTSSSHDRSYEG